MVEMHPVPDPPHRGPSLWQRFLAEMAWLDDFIKRWLVRGVLLSFHVILVVLACYGVMWGMARERCFGSVDDVPARYVGLVMGCAKKLGAEENVFFTHRIDAAAELYQKGKVQFLLVSGDNHREGYNEPQEMKDALISRGVPAEKVYCDYAGFSTLDSIIRAKAVFSQKDCTIISQKFHNERALYMALRTGMSGCVALNAADAGPEWMVKMHARELLARVMAVLDVEVLDTKPKFLGQKQPIGPVTPPVDAPSAPAGADP